MMRPMLTAMVTGLALAGTGMAATRKPAPKKAPASAARPNLIKAGVDAWARGDYPAAVAAWRGPAVAGDADAQFNLGQAYKLGNGVALDMAQAEEWYRKAALQGHQQAEDNYGLALFMNGKKAEAVPWLEKSSARGEPRAQYVLGAMLFNADGVPKDWVRAYALMTRSAATGLNQGVSTLAQMDRYIPADQRQQGQAMARRMEMDAQAPQLAQAGPPPAAAPPYAAPPARQLAQASPPPHAAPPARQIAQASAAPYPAPPYPAPPMRETPLPPSAVAQPEPQPMMPAPAPEHAAPRARSGRPGTVRALPPPDAAPERQPDVVSAPPAYQPQPVYADAPPPRGYADAAPQDRAVMAPPAPRGGKPRDLPYTYTGPIPPAGEPVPGGYAAASPRTAPPAAAPAASPRTPPPAPHVAPPAPAPRPAAPVPRAAPAASGRWRVQLGAFRDRGNADALWRSLSQRVGAFAGKQSYMVAAGAVTRLQAGPFASSAEAARACAQAKPTGTACVVVNP